VPARSIKSQLAITKLPLAKDVDDFALNNTPINEVLVCDFAGGGFLAMFAKITFMSSRANVTALLCDLANITAPIFATSIESAVTALRSYWMTAARLTQEREMLSTPSNTAIAATTALIIGLAPIATADLTFARGVGGGGGGFHVGGGGGGHFDGGHFGGGQFGGGHFGGGQFGGGQFGGSHFGGGFAGGAFRERGFRRHFGRFGAGVPLGDYGGYYAYCGDPYSYPYLPYGPYGYNYCY
jgi:hypothetical protein